MILTITPNPALDVTYRIDKLLPGESHRAAAPRERAGGKGVNVARVANSQGHAAHALTTAGGMTGERFRSELATSGLGHTVVAVGGETRRSIALTENSGAATLINETGAPLTGAEQRQLIEATADLATSALVVVVSGSFPAEARPEFLADLLGALGGLPVIVDTSGPMLIDAARAGVELLKPNAEELQQATGIRDPLEGAHALTEIGARAVLVSLGEAGMALVQRATRAVHLARLPEPLHGNPTGAGDAAVASLATTLLVHGDLASAPPEPLLRQAVAWSAAAVLSPIAGEISHTHHDLAQQVVFRTEATH